MALVVGNAVKAGVRFVSYDHFKNKLADAEVSVDFLPLGDSCHIHCHREKSAHHEV